MLLLFSTHTLTSSTPSFFLSELIIVVARTVEPDVGRRYVATMQKQKVSVGQNIVHLCRRAKRSLVTVAEVGDNAVAMVKLDDGKMNAFSFDMISAIDGAKEDCRDAGAIVISGNEKCLSAGFDLSVMGKGPSPEAGDMLRKGCELALKIAEFPRPTIFAAGGHAMAWCNNAVYR